MISFLKNGGEKPGREVTVVEKAQRGKLGGKRTSGEKIGGEKNLRERLLGKDRRGKDRSPSENIGAVTKSFFFWVVSRIRLRCSGSSEIIERFFAQKP